MRPEEGALTIASDGTVSSRQRVLGNLRVVRLNGPVTALGSNLFQSDAAPVEISASAIKLSVGALENSNVQTTVEMSRLSEITRSYQLVGALLKNSQNADDLNKLGTVPD